MTLQLSEISVRYGGPAVLDQVSLTARPGSLIALIGPNGSGKSSLLRAIAGLQPHKGAVSLDDTVLDARGRGSCIAYMPQDTGATSSLTLMEVVLLGRIDALGLSVPQALVRAARDALDRFNLGRLQHRTLDQVSGGQRQLAFLAQALFRGPRVLLLDEPTSALDLRHQLIVLEQVRNRVSDDGVIAIAAMHDLTLAASFADRIICICDGAIAGDGAPSDVLTSALLRDVYGVTADLYRTARGSVGVVPHSAISA